MPIYNFRNEETGEITEENMKISEREQFLKDNPHMSQVHLSALNIGFTYSERLKPDEGFKDILRESKAHNRGSTIDVH